MLLMNELISFAQAVVTAGVHPVGERGRLREPSAPQRLSEKTVEQPPPDVTKVQN